jgi:hypothetical protein
VWISARERRGGARPELGGKGGAELGREQRARSSIGARGARAERGHEQRGRARPERGEGGAELGRQGWSTGRIGEGRSAKVEEGGRKGFG